MWHRHHAGVRVGVIDVGSNTVRLHIADGEENILGRKALLGLGESIERCGVIPPAKLDEVADTVAGYADEARRRGAEEIEVLVTSPGRQAKNGNELLERLEEASAVPVRLLTATEEGRLGFLGAMSAVRGGSRKLVAVCDVGGGSAQIAIGTRRDGPTWLRSVDIGSMRLTSRALPDDPPGADQVEAARAEVAHCFEGIVPPMPARAYAIGGSARALRVFVGDTTLTLEELRNAIEELAVMPAAEVARRADSELGRARTLAAGAIILEAICERLHCPLSVVRRGGIREGAALELGLRRLAA
jgi:exopolyphosphatase / guanosine-5'-triphosphate,3'-diphosphate pyrophosphatase